MFTDYVSDMNMHYPIVCIIIWCYAAIWAKRICTLTCAHCTLRVHRLCVHIVCVSVCLSLTLCMSHW